MRNQLLAAGLEVNFVSINKSDAADKQDKLIERCAFPLLQDLPEIDVWGIQDGGKDDFYIYGADGALVQHLSFNGDLDLNLSTAEGYDNLWNAILTAF